MNAANEKHAKDTVLDRGTIVELIYSTRKPPKSSLLFRSVKILSITFITVIIGFFIGIILMTSFHTEELKLSSTTSHQESQIQRVTPLSLAESTQSVEKEVASGSLSPPAETLSHSIMSDKGSPMGGVVKHDPRSSSSSIENIDVVATEIPNAASKSTSLVVHNQKAIEPSYGHADRGFIVAHGKRMVSPELEKALQQNSHVVRLNDGSLKVQLPVEHLFKGDLTSLNSTSTQALDYISYVLRNFDGYNARFEVLTMSDTGWTSNNHLALARERGQVLADYLIDHGVPANRIGWIAKVKKPTSEQQTMISGDGTQDVALIIEP